MSHTAQEAANLETFHVYNDDIMSNHALDLCERVFASDYRATRLGRGSMAWFVPPPPQGDGGTGRSPAEAQRSQLAKRFVSIPDHRRSELMAVAKGEWVAARWRTNGTPNGPFMGLPATGRPIDYWEAGFFRFKNGLIVESWQISDTLALARQLGIEFDFERTLADPKPIPERKAWPFRADGGEALVADASTLTDEEKHNVASFRRMRDEVVTEGNVDAYAEITAPDAKTLRYGGESLMRLRGRSSVLDQGVTGNAHEQFRTQFERMRGQRDGYRQTADLIVASGDVVAASWTCEGIYSDEFLGLKSLRAGQPFAFDEVGFVRYVDGKAVEGWYMSDSMGAIIDSNVAFRTPDPVAVG